MEEKVTYRRLDKKTADFGVVALVGLVGPALPGFWHASRASRDRQVPPPFPFRPLPANPTLVKKKKIFTSFNTFLQGGLRCS